MIPMIVADGLTKWYGPRLAIDGISFEVNPGEVMGLLGPNGSGKTTILRILSGYLCPSSGRARIAGLDTIDSAIAARRHIGYVPEDTALYEGMRVSEFLTFMGAIKGLKGNTARTSIARVCERLDLGAVGNLPIGKLSKGFRQRVAIAQALLNQPPVLILDEPTNGLDPKQIIEVRGLIRSLAGAHTILVTSHILSEIEKVADRAAILLGGRLLAVHPLNSGGGPRRLRLRVGGEPGRVAGCLAAIPGVATLSIDHADHEVCVYLVELKYPTSAHQVAAAIVGAGLALGELCEEPVDLEAVFLELTGGHQPEAAMTGQPDGPP
jgi:gliding motility-associated transport system ATP-binding protein